MSHRGHGVYLWSASTHSLQEGAVIESEEDAERALRLSSALTQKLLAYRFKTVSSVSC